MSVAAATHDADAEQGIIGAILVDRRTLALMASLESDDFKHPPCRRAFDAIRNLESRNAGIDLVTIADEIDRYDSFKPSDGQGERPASDMAAELGACALRCPTDDMVSEYVEIVKRHRKTRDARTALSEVLEAIRIGDLVGDDAVQAGISALMAIESGASDERARTLGQIIRAEFKQAEADLAARAEGRMVHIGMPTGLAKLDRKIGGLPFGVQTIVLSRPANGKTTVAQNLARAAVDLGNDTPLIYSYEDGWTSFAQRGLANETGVATEAIRSRDFNREQFSQMSRHAPSAMRRPEIVIQAAGMTVEELVRDVKSRRLRHKGERTMGRLVIVDYIQMIPLPPGNDTLNNKLGEISKKLSDLAQRENIAVVTCSQANREVEKREYKVPQMHDASDCNSIERHGKTFLSLYRPSIYGAKGTTEPDGPAAEPSLLEMHVLKNYNGEAFIHVDLHWDLATHSIYDSREDWVAKRRR